MIVEATADNFNEETSSGIVLIDFYGSACSPCETLGMILKAARKEFKELNVKVVKADVQECSGAALEYAVASVPSVHLVIDGVKVDSFVGMRTKQQIIELIEKGIAK